MSSSNLSGSKLSSGLKIAGIAMLQSIDSRMIANASSMTSAARSFFDVSPSRNSAVRARSSSSVIAWTLGSSSFTRATIVRKRLRRRSLREPKIVVRILPTVTMGDLDCPGIKKCGYGKANRRQAQFSDPVIELKGKRAQEGNEFRRGEGEA